MMQKERKVPTQKRSLEKRNQILACGFQLIMEKGFHNVTTDDIAKEANISVGIIYRYFDNKKTLLLAALDAYVEKIGEEVFFLNQSVEENDLYQSLESLMDIFVSFHEKNRVTHEEMESLRHADLDIAIVYLKFESIIRSKMKAMLPVSIKEKSFIDERVILVENMIEDYCHIMIQPDNAINTNFLKKQVLMSCMKIYCD